MVGSTVRTDPVVENNTVHASPDVGRHGVEEDAKLDVIIAMADLVCLKGLSDPFKATEHVNLKGAGTSAHANKKVSY